MSRWQDRRQAVVAMLPMGRAECRTSARLLQRHLDGELDEVGVETLRAHLEVCRRCGLEAEAYTQIQDALRRRRAEVDAAAVDRLRRFTNGLEDSGS